MFKATRRKLVGATLLGTGAILAGFGQSNRAETLASKGRSLLAAKPYAPRGLAQAMNFPLIDAIHGRRSRRFAKGSRIPDGPLAFKSAEEPQALHPLEQMLLLSTVAGNTGWANLFAHHPGYAPKIPNYTTRAGGRTFPSSAGFNTTEFFFTDDTGVYFLPTRDMTPVGGDDQPADLQAWLNAHKARVVKLGDGRLRIPPRAPHMEGHNFWSANVAGSTLVMPVADLAQHFLLLMLYIVQNGACLFDDVNGRPIPGLERYAHRINLQAPYPLTFVEKEALTDVAVEVGAACHSGALMLQALGLGGWMYTGISPFSVLGASGDPDVPGLGFRFDMVKGNPLPVITGLPGVFEAHVPPHFASMRKAIDSLVKRKFGAGGPFDPALGGPYKDNASVRSSGVKLDAEGVDIAVVMADYILETFGRFPATVPPVFLKTYLQAHRLDTAFYDRYFAGGYLRSHAEHDDNWS
jgi:hypothetical protein